MLVKRKNLYTIMSIIDRIKGKTFNLQTQYKFLKIKKQIEPEFSIYLEQKILNGNPYFVKDENGNPIMDKGGYTIITEKVNEFQKVMRDLAESTISIEDCYFSLDELEGLDLSLEELEVLMDFIR